MNLILFITNVTVEAILDDKYEVFLESLARGTAGFPVVGESLEQEV
jgi:hypothetical protein